MLCAYPCSGTSIPGRAAVPYEPSTDPGTERWPTARASRSLPPSMSSRRQLIPGTDLSVRLAIALAFADASVVVLALPQIVIRLHTSISHVTWVITAYNLALIATTLLVLPVARRLATRQWLVAGLTLFGLASLGSGAAGSLTVLVVFRCLQGIGGAVLLCSSLPLFARPGRQGSELLHAWAAMAALGAGAGPAIGGVLTQAFDWRAIFFAQAPVAAAAALAALRGTSGATATEPARATSGAAPDARDAPVAPDAPDAPGVTDTPAATIDGRRPGRLSPALANAALLLLSAGLIGALFLSTVLLINVWQLTPLGAAGCLAVIPIATVITGELMRHRAPEVGGAAGAVVLAAGLLGLSALSHRELLPAVVMLALCGVGLGLAFPSLTRRALDTHGSPVARAARTVAAREGGLVLGLVLLTPILVNQLNAAPRHATPAITRAVITGPGSLLQKIQLGAGLIAADSHAPQSQLPDLGPAFSRVESGADPQTRSQFVALQAELQDLIERAVTDAFQTPLQICALLSLLALVPLATGWLVAGRAPEVPPPRPEG
jgi:MFS family permease